MMIGLHVVQVTIVPILMIRVIPGDGPVRRCYGHRRLRSSVLDGTHRTSGTGLPSARDHP